MNTFLWYVDPVIYIPYDIIRIHFPGRYTNARGTPHDTKGTGFLKNSSNAMMDSSFDIYSLV